MACRGFKFEVIFNENEHQFYLVVDTCFEDRVMSKRAIYDDIVSLEKSNPIDRFGVFDKEVQNKKRD